MQQTWDCRIAEVVNIVKGAYCFNSKDTNAKAPAALPTEDTATDGTGLFPWALARFA